MPRQTRSRVRHQSRQPATQTSKSQAARQLRPQELEREIWTRHDSKVPGNPRYTDHAPMYSHFLDVHGNTVQIIESRTIEFSASAAGIEGSKIHNKILDVSEVWVGPQYHVLTNALRYLQACCITSHAPQHQYDDKRLLRISISPVELFRQAGMSASQAADVVKILKDKDLLEVRNNGRQSCYYIHLTFKGLGPELQKYTKAEVVDGWALPDDILPPEPDQPNGGADDVSEDDTSADPAEEEGQDELEEPADGSSASVIEMLDKVYQACLKFVPENPEFRDGYALFSTPGPLTSLIPEMTNLSQAHTRQTLQRLGHLKVTVFKMIGRGRWERLIKLDHGPFTEEEVERLRVIARQMATDRQVVQDPSNRLSFLRDAYKAIRETAPVGLVPDKNGYVTYETSFSMVSHLSQEVEQLTEAQAERLLEDFRALGILETTNKGSKKVRRLKVNKRFSSRDVERIRAARRKSDPGKSSDRASAPPRGVSLDADETIVAQLLDRLDGFNTEVEKLKATLEQKDRDLAERDRHIAELEAQLASTPKLSSDMEERLKRYIS
jgi:hypothetical protein